MVVGAFPLFKLGYLAIRQISKPVANQLKSAAKASPIFRRFVCLPIAQTYHRVETIFRMYILGFGKPAGKITPLNEEMAVELGADILGEFIVFGVAAGAVIVEYSRSSAKSREKEEALYARVRKNEEEIEEIRRKLDDVSRSKQSILSQLSAKLTSPSALTQQRPSTSQASASSSSDADQRGESQSEPVAKQMPKSKRGVLEGAISETLTPPFSPPPLHSSPTSSSSFSTNVQRQER